LKRKAEERISSSEERTPEKEGKVLRLEQQVNFNVNGREFVQQIKKDIYEQFQEDSKRGVIKIHEDAVKKY